MPLAFRIVGGDFQRRIFMCGTTAGAKETFDEQVCMPINGRVQCIDRCIHHIIAALNAANVATVASCCGHGNAPGSIMLEDGRCLGVYRDLKEADAAAELLKQASRSTNNGSTSASQIADSIEAACFPEPGEFIMPRESWLKEWCRQLRTCR